jgi:succinylglutamate desuccinylase
MKRLIGEYTGSENETLVIALAAIHGNEPAGVLALRDLFDLFQKELINNPYSKFKGRIVGLIGNLQAYERRIRFVKKDLNREFTSENIEHIQQDTPQYQLTFEDLELIELTQFIDNEIQNYQPKRIVVVDLHTTSASGGIFTLVNEDEACLKIAETLYAPVVKGLITGTGGTTLHYFTTERMRIPTMTIGFEAGQHDDVFSVRRTIAWLVNCLRAVGCINKEDVENRHEEVLKRYSKNLPKSVQIVGNHKIMPHDNFKMQPNYQNFQAIKKDEILAFDKNGAIKSPFDCMILMPLYQAQGSDGFFLVVDS